MAKFLLSADFSKVSADIGKNPLDLIREHLEDKFLFSY